MEDWRAFQSVNGLFPAAISSKNQCMQEWFWLRDNYFAWLALNGTLQGEYVVNGFQQIFDNHEDKIRKNGVERCFPSEDYMHIHPVYKSLNGKLVELNVDSSGNYVSKEKQINWPWIQNDAVGNFLEVLACAEDKSRAELLVDYLDVIRYWESEDDGFWERGPKCVRASSLASCIRGLEKYQQRFSHPRIVVEDLISLGYERLFRTLPNESNVRSADLALATVLWPGVSRKIPDELREKVLVNLQMLEGELGFRRYLGDDWDGEKDRKVSRGEEMQWTMGLPWFGIIINEKSYFDKTAGIKNKFGYLPEGFVDGKPNCTNGLIMAEAIYEVGKSNL